MITPTFYPDPAVGGVRVTQWARHLPEFGWTPTVLCRHHGYHADAEALSRDVHPHVTLRYLNEPRAAQTKKPHALRPRIVRAVTGLMGPNAAITNTWRRQAIRMRVLAAVEETKPDVLLTTSTPHGIHSLGLWLQKRTAMPWVADFRDPYLIDPRYQPRGVALVRYRAHATFERQIYRSADLITHLNPVHARWASLVYREARSRIRLLENGCPADLAEGHVEPAASPPGRISVRSVGVIGEDEGVLLARAIRTLVDEGLDMELRLVGWPPREGDSLRRQLGDRLIVVGRVPHPEALRQIAGATILVASMSVDRSRSLLLSSKLYEYLAVGAPVIMINPTFSDRLFLTRRPGVRLIERPDVAKMQAALQWATSDAARPPAEFTRRFAEQYNRRSQTQVLAGWLVDLLGLTRQRGRQPYS